MDNIPNLGDVLASARFVVERSHHVKIDQAAIDKAAPMLNDFRKGGAFKLANWRQHELNPKELNEATLNWIFVVDTLNFSFYSDLDETPFQVSYKGKEWSGYWSLCASINRALEEGVPITDSAYLMNITMDDVKRIFRSSNGSTVPQLEARYQVLKEAGTVLCEKFNGQFAECIKQADKSSKKLLDLVVANFNSYRDECIFDGRIVKFYKRAQILIADTWACFENQSYGEFRDLDETITMFADYRVPQALAYLGILRYSDEFLAILRAGTPIGRGDPLECEIRAASIWAVELLKQKMEAISRNDEQLVGKPLNAVVIDFFLWDYAKANSASMDDIPIHRTRTIFY